MDILTAIEEGLTQMITATNAMSLKDSSNKYDSKLPPEYDGHRRNVELYLYYRPVEGFDNGAERTAEPAPQNVGFNHWLLVFEFCDQSFRIIEAINEDDILVPSYSKSRSEDCIKSKHLADLFMSPKDVRQLALNNPYNGASYFVLSTNCQLWVNAVLASLGLEQISATLMNDLVKEAEVISWLSNTIHPVAGALYGLGVMKPFFQ